MRTGFFNRLIGGLILIGIGVLFLLNRYDIIQVDIGYIFRTYWPAILIVIGIGQVFGQSKYGRSNWVGGSILIAVGGYFLGYNLDYFHNSPSEFFFMIIPIILILIGVSIIFGKGRKHNRNNSSWDPSFNPQEHTFQTDDFQQFGTYENGHTNHSTDANWNNKSGFIGEVYLGREVWDLRPLTVSYFIADTTIDLTRAQIPFGETKIEITAFIGDVKVFIPNDPEIGVAVISHSFVGEVRILNEKRGGFMNNITTQTPYYHEASKKVNLYVGSFIGDVKVIQVG